MFKDPQAMQSIASIKISVPKFIQYSIANPLEG